MECKEKRNYYHIPFTVDYIVINRKGELFNLRTNKPHKSWISPKGYPITSLPNSIGKWINYQIHRIVGILFIEIPERHIGKSFKDLQINHKDGVKTHNNVDNLEWVTNEENMKHARTSGLFNNEHPVTSRNVVTGQLQIFKSISECARFLFIKPSALFDHITSDAAGRITVDDCVYKYDDGLPWPEWVFPEAEHLTIGRVANVVAKHQNSSQLLIFNSLNEACRMLNLKRTWLNNHRCRKGDAAPFFGWTFTPLTDFITERKRS